MKIFRQPHSKQSLGTTFVTISKDFTHFIISTCPNLVNQFNPGFVRKIPKKESFIKGFAPFSSNIGLVTCGFCCSRFPLPPKSASCKDPLYSQVISETTDSSQTKLIGLNLPIGEHGIGYSNLTPDPKGARGPRGSKFKFHQIKKLR